MELIKKLSNFQTLFACVQRERALCQYGYLKNFSLTFFQLLFKDTQFKTFSKAHIAQNYCCAQFI
jgi:hypothetical protein